ncbi:MAG TPA: cytochrome D1 domain-containing protein [Acidobacteriaceae bacterium]|jgi:DNA-binding beta-propeller fold protein YncE|nr:cytochrome D1 domain-containing protein [Acidobacteriaceae bacterium]
MRRTIVLFVCCAAGVAWFAATAGAQLLLIANQGDHTLSLLSPDSGQTVATVVEGVRGEWGHEVAASADGRTAYLPIYGNSGVGRPGIDGRKLLVIDVPTHRVVQTIDFGHGVRPHLPVLDAQHGLLYVTTELDDAITAIDVKTLRIVGKIPTGQPESHMLALSHDGRLGYTANVGPGTVSVLDMVGRKTLAVIPVVPNVQRIAISGDDRFVFTSDQTRPRLAVIDTAARRVVRWVDLPGIGYGGAATPDGRWLVLAMPATNKVAVIDLAAMKVARTIEVAEAPQEVLMRADGKMAYVSCSGSGQVAAIDLTQWKTTKLLRAGKGADGLGWAP